AKAHTRTPTLTLTLTPTLTLLLAFRVGVRVRVRVGVRVRSRFIGSLNENEFAHWDHEPRGASSPALQAPSPPFRIKERDGDAVLSCSAELTGHGVCALVNALNPASETQRRGARTALSTDLTT